MPPLPRPLLLAIPALLLIAGCDDPPAAANAPVPVTGAAPALVPMEDILAQAGAGTLDDAAGQSLAARGAALRARAAAITTD